VNAVLTYAIMLDLLVIAYVQFMITLIEIEENAKSGTKALVLQGYYRFWRFSYILMALEINKYIV